MRRLKLLIPVLLGLGLTYCSGMISGSHSGKVINSLTREPIEGAEVTVTMSGYIIVGHGSTTIREMKTTTNEKGEYYIWPSLGPPAGIFFSRRAYAVARKDGFLPSSRYQYRTDAEYLVPESEAVMEKLEYLWSSSGKGRFLDPKDPDRVSEFNDVYRYWRSVDAYYGAKKIAKTERELEFLTRFCDRALARYEKITWTPKLEQERVQRCGDRCSYEKLKQCRSTE